MKSKHMKAQLERKQEAKWLGIEQNDDINTRKHNSWKYNRKQSGQW